MKNIRFLILVLFVLFAAFGCSADGALAGSFSDLLSGVVIPAVATLVGVFVISLVRKAEAKLDIDVTAAQEERVRKVAEDAVRFVAEQAATRWKATKGISPMPSSEKREKAVEQVLKTIPDLTERQAIASVHAALSKVGEGATITEK